VHYALGNLYWTKGDRKQADTAFKTAAELSSIKSSRRLAWVEFKVKTGALDEAKQILQEIIQKAPDFLAASVYLGKIAFAQSKYDECEALVGNILARDPSNFEALLLRARVKLARGQSAPALA